MARGFLTSRTLPWRIRFANVLSPDLPTRAGRFLGRRRAANDQGSGLEGRDGRRRVPERRPSEHDYGDVPDHGSEGRPGRRPRISRLPVLIDDLREQAEVPRARLRVEGPEARDFHLRDAAPDGDPPARRVYPPEVGEGPRVPADRAPRRLARGRRPAGLGRAAGVGGREHGPGPRGTGEARDPAARVRDDRRGDRCPLERGTVAGRRCDCPPRGGPALRPGCDGGRVPRPGARHPAAGDLDRPRAVAAPGEAARGAPHEAEAASPVRRPAGADPVRDVPLSGPPEAPLDDRAQTSSLSWRIRSIAPRLKASTSRRARKTAIASKKLRSTLPRRIDSRLTITRIAVRTATTKTVVDRPRRAVSIVRQADGAAVTMESDDMERGWPPSRKNVVENFLRGERLPRDRRRPTRP